MAVSPEVRKYYATNIFAKSGRDAVPPNFAPLDLPHSGMSSVEGCRGGGKNVLEVYVLLDGDTVTVKTPIFGGTKIVTSAFTGETPYLAAFRPKSFEPAGGGVASPHVPEDFDVIESLKERHGLDYDTHATYRFVEDSGQE